MYQLNCLNMNIEESSDDVIKRAADIKIRDVSWFNATYGEDFSFVKDLLTKKSLKRKRVRMQGELK